MIKSRLLFLLVSLACLLPFVTGTLSRAATDDDSLYKHLSVLSEVLSLVQRVYVEETSVEQLLEGALDGTTDALDPLATYVPARVVESYASVRRVGARRSGLTVGKNGGIVFVIAVLEESAGERAGVRPGDILTLLAGQPTRRMPLWQIQQALAAPPGTEVPLELLRQGQQQEVVLTLEETELQRPSLEWEGDVAILRVPSFLPSASSDVESLLDGPELGERERLLVDVRGSAGGEPAEAYGIAGLFATGALGELRGRAAAEETFESSRDPLWEGKVVVLIDRTCQGPAEILASVLQQKVAAALVGRPSFGHAGRHSLVPLSTGGQLFLTDAFYTGPDGVPINEAITPDVAVAEPLSSAADGGGERDPVLRKALEFLGKEEGEALKSVA